VQMDPALKASRSDWVIDNSTSIAETRKQVRALVAEIKDLAGRN
jgi:dephospho-CoA kinase